MGWEMTEPMAKLTREQVEQIVKEAREKGERPDLRGMNLGWGAYLREAYLREAYLRGAKIDDVIQIDHRKRDRERRIFSSKS